MLVADTPRGCCSGLMSTEVYQPATSTVPQHVGKSGAMSTGRNFYEAMGAQRRGASRGRLQLLHGPESGVIDLYNTKWAPAATMTAPRIRVVLKDGRVLYTDGSSAEFFQQ